MTREQAIERVRILWEYRTKAMRRLNPHCRPRSISQEQARLEWAASDEAYREAAAERNAICDAK